MSQNDLLERVERNKTSFMKEVRHVVPHILRLNPITRIETIIGIPPKLTDDYELRMRHLADTLNALNLYDAYDEQNSRAAQAHLGSLRRSGYYPGHGMAMLVDYAEIERAKALKNPVNLSALTREQFYKDFREKTKIYKIGHLVSLAGALSLYGLSHLIDSPVPLWHPGVVYAIPQLFLSYLTSGWCGKEFYKLKDKGRRADWLVKNSGSESVLGKRG